MSNGTIFVQPHSDDAAMSSYFLIKAEVLAKPHYLLTVFGRSNWIDTTKKRAHRYARSKNPVEVTRIRKAEDQKFAMSLGLRLLFFKLEDCLLRNGKVFYQPNKKLDINLVKKVSFMVMSSIKKYGAKNVVAPFPSGLRQHYDHRIVCEAVQLLPPSMCNRFFVDDIPYSRITSQKRHNLQLFTKLKVNDIHDKFQSMKIYGSQMCELYFGQVQKLTRQNQEYERVFMLINQ